MPSALHSASALPPTQQTNKRPNQPLKSQPTMLSS